MAKTSSEATPGKAFDAAPSLKCSRGVCGKMPGP